MLTRTNYIFKGLVKCDLKVLIIEGLTGLAIGILLIFWPKVTLLIIAILMGIWIVFSGISRLLLAYRIRKEIKNEGWIFFNGIVLIILGGVIIGHPYLGITSIMLLIAFGCAVMGVLILMLALRLKKLPQHLGKRLMDLKEEENDNNASLEE